MAQVTLKSLLGNRSETTAWLRSLQDATDSVITVSDTRGDLLFGTGPSEGPSFPVILDGENAGYVMGGSLASQLADLLSFLLRKESEKKKLGMEVLNLYQELNVIYNFSEKLADTIEPDVIAGLTLEQAMHSIPSHSGVILLWDEEKRELLIPARSGESLFDEKQLCSHSGLLLQIGLNGQSEILSDLSVLRDQQIIGPGVQSLIYAAMKVKHRILGAIILAGTGPDQYSAAHLKLLVTLALQSSTAIESAMLYEKNLREVREREEAILKIHEVTKKFVPNEFIRLLGKERLTDVKLGDQAEKNVTVLFTDIRDFTSLSEKMTPEENFRFVSSFNERLGPIIRQHRGFINQYLGDSIMAIFPGDPENALNAAIAMQQAVWELNQERTEQGLPLIRAGIGMHTGPLIMGITGDESRMDAATISDTVNTASRIESLTKYYKTPLLLSGETLQQIPDRSKYHLRQLGEVQLKGKFKLLSIIECINGYPEKEMRQRINTLAHFKKAMSYYHQGHFANSIEAFRVILEKDPDDRTAGFFMENALTYDKNGVPENWSGAVKMLTK